MEKMWGKLWQFPLIILILFLAVFSLRRIIKAMGKNVENIQWREDHPGKIYIINLFNNGLIAPCWEEIIFRGPIILIFNSLFFWSILANAIVSLYFGYVHTQKRNSRFWLRRYAKFVVVKIPTDPGTATHRYKEKQRHYNKHRVKMLILSFSSTALTSFGFGLAALYWQSLYAAVILHSFWNVAATTYIYYIQWRRKKRTAI